MVEGPVLAARQISFSHHGAAAPLFDRLRLEIASGEFVEVLGPNGAGKTTLLGLLGGVLEPAAGEVALNGEPMRSVSPRLRARAIAIVFQEASVLFDFTVLEVALMGRAPHLRPWTLEGQDDYREARKALRELDLQGLEDKRLQSLSSGERQRAFIARALAQQPRILMMDEPTAFLDLKHRLQIYEILKRLNRETGLTVVATSHDLNLAARYGSRLVLLHRGRVAADGTPSEVLSPDRIREVYETEARVERDSATGSPIVVPIAPIRG